MSLTPCADGIIHASGQTCFHCCQPVTEDPAIYWLGANEQNESIDLMLHPACALDFALRLLRDVHAYECQMHLRAVLVPVLGGGGESDEPRLP